MVQKNNISKFKVFSVLLYLIFFLLITILFTENINLQSQIDYINQQIDYHDSLVDKKEDNFFKKLKNRKYDPPTTKINNNEGVAATIVNFGPNVKDN